MTERQGYFKIACLMGGVYYTISHADLAQWQSTAFVNFFTSYRNFLFIIHYDLPQAIYVNF